ncbi:hypothetical protein HanHA89_Chr11g0411991 [Helianthus annuus]|nr:hypothetical protein HanHA89_Chr11g0411991 [Helianthus annuus]
MRYKVQTTGTIYVLLEKSLGLNALQSANHRNHQFTFGKLETKFKILVNHKDHPCTLLYN